MYYYFILHTHTHRREQSVAVLNFVHTRVCVSFVLCIYVVEEELNKKSQCICVYVHCTYTSHVIYTCKDGSCNLSATVEIVEHACRLMYIRPMTMRISFFVCWLAQNTHMIIRGTLCEAVVFWFLIILPAVICMWYGYG